MHLDRQALTELADMIASRLSHQLSRIEKAIKTMSEDVNTELADEAAEEQRLAAAVTANTAAIQGYKDQLAAAIQAAQQSGLTPEQLAEFDAIHAKMAADIDTLAAAGQPAQAAETAQATGAGEAIA